MRLEKTLQSKGRMIAEWKAEVKEVVKPVIKKVYYEDGERMYLSVDGKRFMADIFDGFFNSKIVDTSVKKSRYKGKNPNKNTELYIS